jgi:hypothetical protein
MALAAYVDRVLARALSTPVDLSFLAPGSVPGTIFNGATGVALYFVETARLQDRDGGLLARARSWLDVADAWARRSGPTAWNHLHRGLVHGETGIAFVDALLSSACGEPSRTLAAVQRIRRASGRFDDLDTAVRCSGVIGGQAGIVIATRQLLSRLPETADYRAARDILEEVHDCLISKLYLVHARRVRLCENPLLGMAHGIAGELFVLATSDRPRPALLMKRLGELAAFRRTDGAGHTYWPPRSDGGDLDLVGSWCNGTAGHTLLWTEIAIRTGDRAAARLAAEAARSTEFLMSSNAGLCCGLTGQAIALQRFTDLSGDRICARRAYDRLKRATVIAEVHPALGFWKGTLGVALIALARLRGDFSFPCLSPPATRQRVAPRASSDR